MTHGLQKSKYDITIDEFEFVREIASLAAHRKKSPEDIEKTASKNRGKKRTPEQRKLISERTSEAQADPAYRKHMREVSLGRKRSLEDRQKQGNTTRGKKKPQSFIDKISGSNNYQSIAINCYTKDDTYITTYCSLHDASSKTQTSSVTLKRILTKHINVANGLIWRYKFDCDPITHVPFNHDTYCKNVVQSTLDVHHPRTNNCGAINQFNKDYVFIATFLSAKEAQSTGASRSKICEVCRRKRPFAGGFIWRYASDCDPVTHMPLEKNS